MVAAFAILRNCIRTGKSINQHFGFRLNYLSIGSTENRFQHISSFRLNQKMSSTGENKTAADGISETDAGEEVKTASQLKKEAKRLAKLEKFSKKQEQSKQNKPKEVYTDLLSIIFI